MPGAMKKRAGLDRKKRLSGSQRKSASRPRDDEEDEDEDEDDSPSDRSATVASLEARYGSVRAALTQVLNERHTETKRKKKYRALSEELEAELADLREALGLDGDAEIPEGSVLLSKTDKEELDKFRALGKLDEVTVKVKEHSDLKSAADKTQSEKLYGEAAELASYKPSVLTDIISSKGLLVELRDETVDGEKKKVPFVRENKEGSESTRLTEYVEKNLKDYLPALTATEGGSSGSGGGGGVTYPRTGGGNGSPTASAVSRVADRDFRPSKAGKGE